MRMPQLRSIRSGVVLAEAALVTLIFLFLLFVVIDFGLGVFRQFTISQATRSLARQTIEHGVNAPTSGSSSPAVDFGGPWGPSTVTINNVASSGLPEATFVKPKLYACDKANTTVTITWPDGTNKVNSPVVVKITTPYQPILTRLFGGTITLQADSTMLIAH